MTTPATSAPDSAARARVAIGTALGIVSPSAVPLRDGSIWLTSRQDVLPAHIVRAMDEQLRRRATDHASDERILAEAVAVLGAEIARARGSSPAEGATTALDRLLHVPGLDQSRRTEAEATLRFVLRQAAQESPEAAARLAALPGEPKPPVASEIMAASAQISRDARLLTTGAAAAGPGTGSQRPQVGRRHRRAPLRQTLTREVRGTGLVASGRRGPELSEATALAALAKLGPSDLGSSVTSRPTILAQDQLAAITTTASDSPQYFRVEVMPTVRGLVAQGRIRSGTQNDPHVLRISPGLADEQLGQVWVHQLSLMTQQLEAANAGRPTGVLGRLRSVFSHERRDRRLNADLAAYRQLSQDWHQAREETLANGRPSGPLSVADLERDIQGLASAIERRSGRTPTLPWAGDSIDSSAAAQEGIAAERAAVAATPAPNSPGHLREQVVAQITTLEAAVADLETQAEAKKASAKTAAAEAAQGEIDAEAEEKFKDGGAVERARKLRVTAVTASNKARRHKEIEAAYRQAGADAGEALAGYRSLLSELDAAIADPDRPQARVAELAAEAAAKTDVYEASLRHALPVDHLETGVPTGPPLTVPADEINRVLAAHGSSEQITRGAPRPAPGAEYRRLLSPDGMVFTVGGDPDDDVTNLTQVRLRLKARDLTEVIDRDYNLAEQMSGTIGDGGQGVATTSTHSSTFSAGVNLQPFMAMAPAGSAVQVASQLVAPRIEGSSGRTLAETSGASAHFQHGWVDDNRGESLLYEWSGTWEVEVRTSATEPWSPVETVDAGRQLTWVSSAYTVQPPGETVTLEQLGRGAERSEEFPRHTVTRFTGLQSIADRLVTDAREKVRIDRVGYDHITGLITQDTHRLLREAAKPGGLSRPIPLGGESEYELTLEVEPIWSTAELSGESSSEMWQEEVQVDFGGVNASQVFGTSLSGSAALAYPGQAIAGQPVPGYLPSPTALSDVGSSTADVSPNVSAGRSVSRHGGQHLSATSITPVVNRNQGPTQGVIVDLKVTATLHKIAGSEAEPVAVVEDTCKARLRLPENDLLRAGGPADKNAVRRADDGTIRLDQDGRALLRGDPEPPTGPQSLPPWNGDGQNQLRGPGKALSHDLKGATEAREQALTELSKLGLVPPLDKKFKPRMDALPSDPRRRAGQLWNYDRVMHHINEPRIEAGINQACQAGLPVMLVDQRTGHAPRYRPFRLSVRQDFGDVTGRGTNPAENVVRLGIASDATGRTSGQSKSVPVSGRVGVSDGPPAGVQGWAGRLGLKLSRNAIGRSFGWTVGRRVNRVTLNESTAPVDKLRQGLRITFTEVTDKGDSEPLADVPGSVLLTYDSALTRAEAPVFEQQPKTPHPEAVRRAIPVAVDAGEPADRLFAEVSAIRADSTAYLQLHTLLSPDSLVAHTDWMNGNYELPMVVVPAPANPAQALEDRTLLPQQLKVVIRGQATGITYAATSEQNTGDINFTMNDVGFTSGTSASGGAGVDGGGGPLAADSSSSSGGASIGRTGGTSQSTSNSQTTGEERLLVNVGTHHEFIERYTMVADIMEGDRVVQTVPLQDALAQKAMAERRALELYGSRELDLPLPVVADAAERYLTGKLELSPRTATGFVRRYKQEKAGVTTGLAAQHTDERLADKVRGQSRVTESTAPTAADRLDDTLVSAQQVVDQRRVVGLPEQYGVSLASSQLESIRLEGKPDQQVDLRALVKPQIQELAPGLLAASSLLESSLKVDLGRDSNEGPLENMLGPRGYVAPIEVPIEGREHPDVLLIRVKARYEGDITVDGTPEIPEEDGTLEIPKEEAIGLGQGYNYVQRDRSVSHTTTYSGGVEVKAGDSGGGSLAGGVGADRVRQVTAGSGEQNTTLDRTGHFDMAKVTRTLVFTTEVLRMHNVGVAAMASRKWKLARTKPAEHTTYARPRQLRAQLTALVPRGVIGDPAAVAAQQTPDERLPEHRSFQLPESAVVETAVPYGRGEEVTDQLYDRLSSHLAQPGVLGAAGMAEYQAMVETQLQPTALKAKFEELTSANGLEMVPMAVPGNGRTTVAVVVHAKPVGWELEGDPLADGQTGKVKRRQAATRSSTTGNHLTPLTATAGVDGGVAGFSHSIGEQVKEQSSDAHGTRPETSKFENGDLVTVRIPVVYDVTVDKTTDQGRGTPQTKQTTKLQNAAKAQYYVKMLKHEYLEGLRQLEAGASPDAVLAGARLQAVPTRLGKPDLQATEYGQDGSGKSVHQPYRPLLDAIAKAKAEQTTVVLSVREADGHDRLYQAFPDGTMAGVNDGGFASAFATLHPTMALMAEGRVDLRQLYNTSSQGGSFSPKVAKALEDSGVPTSVLKGLDYATTARLLTSASTQGTKRSASGAAAGRTIAPTGHGPSLSGP